MQGRSNSSVLLLLRILAAIAIAGIALSLLDWKALMAALSRAGIQSITVVGLMIFAVHLILAWRWHVLVSPVCPKPFFETLRIYLFANFFNSFSPANVGGDVYRAAALTNTKDKFAKVIEALLRERLLGLESYVLGMVLAGAAVLLAGTTTQMQKLMGLTLLGGLGLLVMLAILSPTASYLHKRSNLHNSATLTKTFAAVVQVMEYRSQRVYLLLLAQSMLAWAIWIGALQVTANVLGLKLGFAEIALAGSVTEIIRLIPVSPQGIGIREASFSYLAFLLGAEPEAAFAVSAITYAVLSVVLLLSGPLAIAIGHHPLDTARLLCEMAKSTSTVPKQ